MRPTTRISTAVASVAAAAALCLAVAAPAAAMAPTTIEEQFTRVLNNHCPDFAIRSTFWVDRRVTTFYDNDGTAIRRVTYGFFPGQVQNLSTGYTLPSYNVRVIEQDLVTGVTRSTGTNVRVYEPQGGTIQLTAGIQEFDASGALIFSGGRLDVPPSPELCAALAAG